VQPLALLLDNHIPIGKDAVPRLPRAWPELRWRCIRQIALD